jgi:hypothetical protein
MKRKQAILNRLVIPKTVRFTYGEQDSAENELKTMLEWRRAQKYKLYFETGMPKEVIWQIMYDAGDLTKEQLKLLGRDDVTPGTHIDDSYKSYMMSKGDWGKITWPEVRER